MVTPRRTVSRAVKMKATPPAPRGNTAPGIKASAGYNPGFQTPQATTGRGAVPQAQYKAAQAAKPKVTYGPKKTTKSGDVIQRVSYTPGTPQPRKPKPPASRGKGTRIAS